MQADSPSSHLALEPRPAGVATARHFVTSHVPDPDAHDVLALLTSELVTNGILHARTELTLGVTTGQGRVLVTVADGDTEHPIAPPPDDSRQSGRGIVLIEALASQWGVLAHAQGKTVWFTVPYAADELPRVATA